MATLPSLIFFYDIPEEALSLLVSFLGQDGLKDKVKRNGGISFSSTVISFESFVDLLDLLRQSQEETARLQAVTASPEKVRALEERIKVLEHSLEEAQETSGLFQRDIDLLKNKLREVLSKYLYAVGIGNDKFIGEVKALLEAT